MTFDWAGIRSRLDTFWAALPPEVRILSRWSQSRRFPEVTYLREELLGSYKARKYLSLLPWLEAQGHARVLVHGSTHSGNVTQLGLELRERGLEPFFRRGGRGGPPAGNLLLSQLVYGTNFDSAEPGVDFEIPEGGSCPPALAGSLGLVGSLVEQALERKIWKPDIFIDSGTGFTAAALLSGLAYFELPCRVVVVSMTGQSKSELLEQLLAQRPEYERLLQRPASAVDFEVVPPPVGPSFGSLPTAALEEVAEFARWEGILVDPLYAAKLSLLYQSRRDPERPAFIFVSGGARELLCFQGPLRKWLTSKPLPTQPSSVTKVL
ncbi:MAG: hypothetical protein WC314_04045 [Vulcanimicrobiota bacterium]